MQIKEYNIIKISLITFLFLFILLFYLDSIYSPNLTKISSIDKSYFNKIVKLEVKIEKQRLKNQTLFLSLSDNSSKIIDGIIFKTNLTLDYKQNYEIIGRISLYKNEFEILITQIKIIE